MSNLLNANDFDSVGTQKLMRKHARNILITLYPLLSPGGGWDDTAYLAGSSTFQAKVDNQRALYNSMREVVAESTISDWSQDWDQELDYPDNGEALKVVIS